MRTIQYHTDELLKQFIKNKILTLDVIKKALGTQVKMTVFRKLKTIPYSTSYSHAGKYYTLDKTPIYDEYGLYSFNNILFSKYGSLIDTVKYFINGSENGYFASELKKILKVHAKNSLLKLYSKKAIRRRQIGSKHLYLSLDNWQIQLKKRKELIQASEQRKELCFISGFDSPDVRRSLQCFMSMLNEKQRRLYAGFESIKLGHGGDETMSNIIGMNVKTIARGRKELLLHDITPEKIREEGSGRHSLKKKLKLLKS